VAWSKTPKNPRWREKFNVVKKGEVWRIVRDPAFEQRRRDGGEWG